MVHDVDVVGGSIYFGEWTDRDVCASPEHLCNSVWGGSCSRLSSRAAPREGQEDRRHFYTDIYVAGRSEL